MPSVSSMSIFASLLSCAPEHIREPFVMCARMAFPKPTIPSGLGARIDEARPYLDLLRARYEASAGQPITMRDDAFNLMRRSGLMLKGGVKRISQMGFQPRNRSKGD